MPLTAPTIKSQVSVCSSILIEGNLTGATAKVFQNSNATPIGQGVASSSQQWVSINAGVVLQQGDLISAMQTLGSDAGRRSPRGRQLKAMTVGYYSAQSTGQSGI